MLKTQGKKDVRKIVRLRVTPFGLKKKPCSLILCFAVAVNIEEKIDLFAFFCVCREYQTSHFRLIGKHFMFVCFLNYPA